MQSGRAWETGGSDATSASWLGHPGVRRAHHFARHQNPLVTRKPVQKLVAMCRECRSIDLAPVQWRWENWSWTLYDVTGKWWKHGCRHWAIVSDGSECELNPVAVWKPMKAQREPRPFWNRWTGCSWSKVHLVSSWWVILRPSLVGSSCRSRHIGIDHALPATFRLWMKW